ncbi:MAG: hypothetical protein HQ538_02240 [Parcubacteria group bacterium]|nr:hypothetical protein [Parcubacteria group bacterium]
MKKVYCKNCKKERKIEVKGSSDWGLYEEGKFVNYSGATVHCWDLPIGEKREKLESELTKQHIENNIENYLEKYPYCPRCREICSTTTPDVISTDVKISKII